MRPRLDKAGQQLESGRATLNNNKTKLNQELGELESYSDDLERLEHGVAILMNDDEISSRAGDNASYADICSIAEDHYNNDITRAERTLSLADAAGVADEKPVSHAADTKGMSKMEADLTCLADYDADLNRLDRAYDELGTSPAVDGASSYAEACSAAVSYHQAQLDDINSTANTMTAVCIAVFALGIAGAAWSAIRISGEKEK